MTITLQITAAAMVLFSFSTSSQGPENHEKRWVWLQQQGVWGYGYQIQGGEHQGLWRIDFDSKTSPEAEQEAADPYGFAAILNQYRASAGLPALAYDPGLTDWASRNNAQQAMLGLGHHVNPNCFQNSAWNTPDARSTADEWMRSPAHRANMLSPTASRFGIAYGPGPYWTMNAQ